jgi:hypothetical protein
MSDEVLLNVIIRNIFGKLKKTARENILFISWDGGGRRERYEILFYCCNFRYNLQTCSETNAPTFRSTSYTPTVYFQRYTNNQIASLKFHFSSTDPSLQTLFLNLGL